MAFQLAPETPYAGEGLARVIAAFRRAGRMDMAFGGRVLPEPRRLQITELCGARTRSLAQLMVRPGAGLGGKSLLLGRPVSVSSYPAAQGITHVYDHAVSQEGLETVIALPIIVDDVPRIVVYLANRTQVGLGDRWFDSLAPLVRRLERDIAVEDEVRRRLDEMRDCRAGNEGLTQSDLRELSDELAAVAEQVDDETLRARIELLRTRLSPSGTTTRRRAGVGLAPREVDVLTQVALGRTNREAAEQLGLLPNTVNSYLKTAMRKLGANNRVRAITAARETGLIT